MRYHFDWDDEKNTVNFKKHGIWFEEARTIWADPKAREFFDDERSHSEDRYVRVGFSTLQKVLLVVFCERDDGNTVRIVSARKATRKEREQYEEGV